MHLHNIMEDEILNIINEILSNRKDICTCDRCKLDIAALTLNKLKPIYVVTGKGELYAKTDMMNNQFDVDIIKEVTKSVEIVNTNPHHGEGDEFEDRKSVV